ncbi:MAG: type I DNA topoisomerase [Candidatus Omnitrophica bacterium]|nr:type I DNA topoisomerase [Candidatus Omnitrophota bacterium]
MSKAIVIVESPAKSKTINKILGKDFEVYSSMGHMVDLPKNKMGVDVENNFEAVYIVIPERRKYLAKLKKEAKKKETIYLAADPDREGEAISWHLKNELGKNKKVYRVSFDEITEHAVREAFKHPRAIDMNLVKAQQARRILDRIVGYSISPLLWVKVTKGLSAGRVQSVAVRIIVDRENEIRAFKPVEYWELEAVLKKKGEGTHKHSLPFSAYLDRKNGEKIELHNTEETAAIVRELEKESYNVKEIKEGKKRKHALPPLTTSKLQQEAFNKLRYPVNKTMRIAQALYEGLEIGDEGSVGLITYMRTDSVKVSQDAQKAAKEYVLAKFGNRYYPETPNLFKSKKSAQEAHECIRPTLPLREPESLRKYLTPEQHKLYELIWNRFLASQMQDAVYLTMAVSIAAGIYLFKATGTALDFDGFMVLYKEEREEEKDNVIPPLAKDELLDLVKLLPSQHFTKPPARYSDASLVKALEELGIGRPSTYAPTILTICLRNYVKRVGGYLHPTDLGEAVNELLVKHFPKILDIKFTAKMEDELDGIEDGETDPVMVLKSFYSPFMHSVEKAKLEMKSIRREGIKTDEICPTCGKPLIIKWGRRGKFLSCSGYPECTFAKSITSGVKCPQEGCGGELVERHSKRGAFYGCTNYPRCMYTSRRLPKDEPDAGDTKTVVPSETEKTSPEGDPGLPTKADAEQ